MHALTISEQDVSLHAESDSLVLYRRENPLRRVRVRELDQVLLVGRVELTSGAIFLLLRRGVDVVWLTQRGDFRGRLINRSSKNIALRLAQYQRTTDEEFCRRIAASFVGGKIRRQRQILLRAQRRLRDDELAVASGQLRMLAERVRVEEPIDTMRGLEGQAAATYFGQFGKLLRNGKFSFRRRTRRPPRDEVNALLSFGYAVLGSIIETEMYRCGLDPMLGFFHQPAYGRASLMLDLLEEFRPTVDALVLRVVNRRQLSPGDFVHRSGNDLARLLNDDTPQTSPILELSAGSETQSATEDPPSSQTDQASGPSFHFPRAPGDSPEAAGEATGTKHQASQDRRAEILAPWESEDEVSVDSTANGSDQVGSAKDNGGKSDVESEIDIGVYLGDVGRRIFLSEFFRRLRERLHYPPRAAKLELREIVRQQIYLLSRVIEGAADSYEPFEMD